MHKLTGNACRNVKRAHFLSQQLGKNMYKYISRQDAKHHSPQATIGTVTVGCSRNVVSADAQASAKYFKCRYSPNDIFVFLYNFSN